MRPLARASILTIGALTLGLAAPALAHHSYAMFDRTKTVALTGAIRNFEMVNPHSYVWLTVKTDAGEQIWGLEGGGVSAMQKAGLTKASVKVGDPVTVEIHPLRDGRSGGQLLGMRLKDGRVIGAPVEPPRQQPGS